METLGLAARLGITIVVLVVTGLGAGFGLDAFFGSSPIFTLVGAIIGISWSLWAIFKLTQNYREPLLKKKKK